MRFILSIDDGHGSEPVEIVREADDGVFARMVEAYRAVPQLGPDFPADKIAASLLDDTLNRAVKFTSDRELVTRELDEGPEIVFFDPFETPEPEASDEMVEPVDAGIIGPE